MKKIYIYLFAALALVVTSCQNNGDIGDYFGTWRVESYFVDGVSVTDNVTNTTFSFQASVVHVTLTTDEFMSQQQCFGSWSEEGDRLTLNFANGDDSNPVGTNFYHAPAWLGMTSDAPMSLIVSERSGSKMTWTYTTDSGTKHIYKLKKTW